MAETFPVTIGEIIIRRFDNRVSRYVGNCSCGEKITLSRYEFKHQSIKQCAECRGMRINRDDSLTDRQGRTPSTPSKVEPGTPQTVNTGFNFEETIIGRYYGQLQVTKILPKSLKFTMRRVEVHCMKCGEDKEFPVHALVNKHKSKGDNLDCGCSKPLPSPKPKRLDSPDAVEALSIPIKSNEDLTGLRMGHLRILRQASAIQTKRAKIRGRGWVVQCAVCKSPTIYILSTGSLTATIKQSKRCPKCPQHLKAKKSVAKAKVAAAKPKPVKVPSSPRKAPSKASVRSGVIG